MEVRSSKSRYTSADSIISSNELYLVLSINFPSRYWSILKSTRLAFTCIGISSSVIVVNATPTSFGLLKSAFEPYSCWQNSLMISFACANISNGTVFWSGTFRWSFIGFSRTFSSNSVRLNSLLNNGISVSYSMTLSSSKDKISYSEAPIYTVSPRWYS